MAFSPEDYMLPDAAPTPGIVVGDMKRGLPANVDAERSILGAVFLDNVAMEEAVESLAADDFSLDSHRRIYRVMLGLHEYQRAIDIITVADVLTKQQAVEAVGGIAYLASLTDCLPRRPSIESYVRIVKDAALLRSVVFLCSSTMEQATDRSEAAEDVIHGLEAGVYDIAERRVTNGFMTPAGIMKESYGSVDALVDRGKRITGVETHFTEYDNLTGGLQNGDLIIIAARPGVGKSSFALNAASNACLQDSKVVAVFSLEMSKESLLLRLLCSVGKVDSHKLRTGYLNREDRQRLVQALNELSESRMFIDDTPAISLSELRAKSRRLMHQEKALDLIVVDYLQLMTLATSRKRGENREQEVAGISRGLKALAKELKVPVMALAQLNRSADGSNRPTLAMLRESGSIEQDADVVSFLYREEMHKPDDQDVQGLAEVITAKQRNGPIGAVNLVYLKQYTRFDNVATMEEKNYGLYDRAD